MELLLLILFYIIAGLPYYIIFLEAFRPSHKLLSLSYSAFLGFLFFTLIQLVLGFFHVQIAGPQSWLLKIMVFLTPMVIFISRRRRDKLRSIFSKSEYAFYWTDYVLVLIVVFLFLSLYNCVNQNFYLGYDEFRIWLVNPKEIFTSGYLRFDIEVMDDHKLYNSFFALAIANIYDVFGGVFETRGAYITQICALIYVLMIWDQLMRFDWAKRFYVLISSILIVLSFNNTFIKLLFINYIEVQLALFFFVIIFLAFLKRENTSSWIKGLWILLICFYVVGSSKQAEYNGAHNFLIPIIFLFLIYNYCVHKKLISDLIFGIKNYLISLSALVICLAVLSVGHLSYFSHLSKIDSPNISVVDQSINPDDSETKSSTFHKLAWPFKKLIKGLSSFDANRCFDLIYEYFVQFTIVSVLLLFFVFTSKPSYSSAFIMCSIFFLLAFVILGFTIKGKDITNNSFHRYLTHGFFAIPLIFTSSRGFILKSQKVVSLVLCLSLLFCCSFKYANELAQEFSWMETTHEKSLIYSNYFNRLTSASFDAYLLQQEIQDKRTIFIDGTFSDGQNEELYTQYLLQANSVGGELKSINSIVNRSILEHVQHEYIVIFDFDVSISEKLNFEGEIPDKEEVSLFKKNTNKSYTYIPLNK